MTRGILIAGNESTLLSAVAAETEKRVKQYAEALIRSPVPITAKAGLNPSKGRIAIDWNPASPVSCRTLVLSAENRLGQINDAVLVCSPPALYCAPEGLVPAEIESRVNIQIKGWFFLIRELAVYFRSRGSGTMTLISPESYPAGGEPAGNSAADFLGSAASSSFNSIVKGMLSCASGEPFQTLGFSFSESGREQEFAQWVFRILDQDSPKNSGKWHRFGKFTFFK